MARPPLEPAQSLGATLFDTAPIGIYQSLGDGTLLAANPALARVLGYASPAELLKVNLRDVYFDAAEREQLIAQWEPLGAAADLQVRWRRKDGSVVWVNLTAHAVKDERGETRYFQGFVRDASADRAARDLLARSEERLRTVIEATHHAVWEWDFVTDTILWGDGFVRLFGEDEGSSGSDADRWRLRIHPRDVERVSASLAKAIGEGHSTWQDEYRFRRSDGTWAVVIDRGRVVRDAEGDPVRMVGAMVEVTEQRRAEEQLRHAQKMEAVGQLTGGIAHDFNNLLTVILANAELVVAELGKRGTEVDEELHDIQSAARRGQVMVRKLLGFARRTTLELRAQDLGALVDDAGDLLRRLIPASIAIRVEAGQGPHDIFADQGAVEQILVNLATNARDAMPEGGVLRIGVHRTYLFDVPEESEGARPGTYVCLTVTDSGQGMDDTVRARMFEPFFTTKPADQGTGLGLAMVYGLVRQHDGFLQITTSLGQGTTVRIFFPVARREAARPSVPVKRAAPAGQAGELVLIAEDEDEVRSACRRVLERLGYQVLAAEDGEAALELFRIHRDRIDLVLTDVVMPRRNGPQLREAIRAEGSSVPILFASGYPARDLEAAAALPPDTPLLRKPWTVDELAAAVGGALRDVTTAT